MLEFNPDKRSSVKHLLNDKIFDEVRVKKYEIGAPYQIQLDVDHLYGFELDLNGKLRTDEAVIDQYRQEIIKMAHKYRKYLK